MAAEQARGNVINMAPPAPTARMLSRRVGRRALLLMAAGVALLAVAALSGRVAVGVDLLLPAGLALTIALAYANGANDVSKAIATLVGSGVTRYRRAIAWGALCTILGSLASAAVAAKLIGTFTSGFLASGVQQTETFALAILMGAILWVTVATRTGLPVSTTHAITGALVTAGAFAYGAGSVRWASLVRTVALPLALSPLLALAVALAVYYLVRVTLARLLPERALNGLHWLSSGTASFARGLNDTPKIVALGVAFSLITLRTATYAAPFWLFALVALGMGVGSFAGGLKVTETLAEKVTKMDHVEGLAANLVTAFLVAEAANLGLPVSTTHVSAGAIIGIGLRGGVREGVRRVDWRVVRGMALAWIITLPAAGVLAVAAYIVLRLAHGGEASLRPTTITDVGRGSGNEQAPDAKIPLQVHHDLSDAIGAHLTVAPLLKPVNHSHRQDR